MKKGIVMPTSLSEASRHTPHAQRFARRYFPNHGNAFTLIELLVVIGILALLAAILFPVFMQARAKSRQATCTSNLRQMAMAQMQYLQDYDGSFQEPILGYAGGGSPLALKMNTLWYAVMLPYVKEPQIFTCPESRLENNPFDSTWIPGQAKHSLGMNYYLGMSYNYYYYVVLHGTLTDLYNGPFVTPGYPRPVTEDLIHFPAHTVLFGDSFDKEVEGRVPLGYALDPEWGYRDTGSISERHNDGANIAFVDGHVRWYKTPRLLSQKCSDDWTDPYASEMCNYNAAGVIWDVDGDNVYTKPGKWPTFCCRN